MKESPPVGADWVLSFLLFLMLSSRHPQESALEDVNHEETTGNALRDLRISYMSMRAGRVH